MSCKNYAKLFRLLVLYIPLATTVMTMTNCSTQQNEEVIEEVMLMELPSPSNTVKFLPPEVKKDEEIIGDENAPEVFVIEDNENVVLNPLRSRKIIKEGDITLESRQPEKIAHSIKNRFMQLGGYISNEYSSDDYLEQTIHIPADTLDYFLAAVSALKDSRIRSKRIYSKDITRNYVDTESRITSKRQQLEIYSKLLNQAKSVADVVNVEKERSKVLEDLEAQIASMNTMKQQLSYSKVDITIHNLATLNSNHLLFTDGIQAAWQDSFSNFKELIYSIVRNWYWWIIIITIGLWGIQFYKRKKALQD